MFSHSALADKIFPKHLKNISKNADLLAQFMVPERQITVSSQVKCLDNIQIILVSTEIDRNQPQILLGTLKYICATLDATASKISPRHF